MEQVQSEERNVAGGVGSASAVRDVAGPGAEAGRDGGDGTQLGKTLLRVRNLRTHFVLRKWGFLHVGSVRAVDGVSFDLRRQESIAVVGESGCGKTTLAKTILGLNNVTSGAIEFDGNRIDDLKPGRGAWYRRQVGFVQQDPYGALPSFMDVRHILEEPLRIHGIRDPQERYERIEHALEEVRLRPVGDYLDKYPHMLSGGQQQRLVIARAIILGPKMLVADEPVSMLDASVRVEILNLLRALQEREGLGMIYITHDLSTVRYFSERIFVMYGGKLIEQGPVEELLQNAKHPYTRALLEAIPDPDGDNALSFRRVPGGEPPSLKNPPAGCRYHPRCPFAIPGLCDRVEPPNFAFPRSEHETGSPGELTAAASHGRSSEVADKDRADSEELSDPAGAPAARPSGEEGSSAGPSERDAQTVPASGQAIHKVACWLHREQPTEHGQYMGEDGSVLRESSRVSEKA